MTTLDDFYGTRTHINKQTHTHTHTHKYVDATEQVSGHSERVACAPQGCAISCRKRKE